MNILIFGGTGRVGNQILKLANQEGHRITALVRTPSKITNLAQKINIVQGDVLNRNDILKVMEGNDVVISALSTDGTSTLSDSFPLIIEAMTIHGIKRIITVGTAGILNSRMSPGLLRYQSSESKHKSTWATEEHHNVYKLLSQSKLDWTIVCPTYLAPGEYTGNYRTEVNLLPKNGVTISIPDTAEFTYHQIKDDKSIRARVGIAY